MRGRELIKRAWAGLRSPLYTQQRTNYVQPSECSDVPQHKVAALQPASRGQEPKGLQPVERTAIAGWQGQHDQQALSACNDDQTARSSRGQDPAEPHRRHPKRNDKIALTSLECAEEISAHKRLIRAMPLNKDRSINRTMVVRCVISATPNYLKLHVLKTLNPLLRNIHAETQKLWKRSAMQAPFDSLQGFPACTHARRLALPLRLPSKAAVTWNLPSARCQPVPNFPRLRALALFGRRPHQRVVSLAIPATKNLHRTRLMQCSNQSPYSITWSALVSSVV